MTESYAIDSEKSHNETIKSIRRDQYFIVHTQKQFCFLL